MISSFVSRLFFQFFWVGVKRGVKADGMPTCSVACPAYSHAARVAARLNARFVNASGVGLEQGLLIHGLDHQTSGSKKQWWNSRPSSRQPSWPS